jgi:hypothetical protein
MAREKRECCAVCADTRQLTGIVVAERVLFLCGVHAAKLGKRAPRDFDDLAALFARPGLDRRTGPDRRRAERRMFPPRPELRRQSFGRRDDDPVG